MHTAFIRQLIFELIPFFVLFGIRDIQFINIASAADFFNSIIGRSMMGMIGFTFVTYFLTNININKLPTKNTTYSEASKQENTEETTEQNTEQNIEQDNTIYQKNSPVEFYHNYRIKNNKLDNLLLQKNNKNYKL
jgi:hypothetical protein